MGDKLNKLLYSKNEAVSAAAGEAYNNSVWSCEVWLPVSIMRDPISGMRTNIFVVPQYYATKEECTQFIKSTVLCERFYQSMELDELPEIYRNKKVEILAQEKKKEFVRLLFAKVKGDPLLMSTILDECRE